ncbi:3'-5' exonuclease [Brachyspira hyodysenteriae]|uniref:3'-5' exonuclease n=1 Tax=Brachyspira hyodysenteriae TaxID=159 RepID=UPI0022CD3F00|nr:3'-5' exonuclease [Brachyspira hyodysenteriae]MCZ9979511.1 3'-5' exonuclease [Brachyspira hyodysenteriae]MDA0103369.1 3'-5' exonuclease [Brachyspira hyodysenteriae]
MLIAFMIFIFIIVIASFLYSFTFSKKSNVEKVNSNDHIEIIFEYNEPRKTGKLLRDFPANYTIIDVETTGLKPREDKIIEIGAIKYRDNKEIDYFSTLVKVDYIPNFISSYTNITNKMVKNAPRVDEAIKQFYDFVGDDILVGYNVPFDIKFLYDALYEVSNGELLLNNDFIDVMYIAKRVLKDLENYKQVTVASYYNISIDNLHRAMGDCKLCSAIYECLQKDILEKWGAFNKFYKKISENKK